MSIAQNHSYFAEILRAANSGRVTPAAILISPWQVNLSQDHEHGLDECGCAFCPDDDQKTI